MKDPIPYTFEPWGTGLQQVVVYFPFTLTEDQAKQAQATLCKLLHQKSRGANVQFWVVGKTFFETMESLKSQLGQ